GAGAGGLVAPITCGWSDVTVRSTGATGRVPVCGCTTGGGLTTTVSLDNPLAPADSTAGTDSASSNGSSSVRLRLIRMRRLSDLAGSSAVEVPGNEPAL